MLLFSRVICALQAPSAASLDASKARGELRLWRSFERVSFRPVAVWELKTFFKTEDDMQRQLGFRSAADQDRTTQALVAASVGSAGGSLALQAQPQPSLQALGLLLAAAPFTLLGVYVAAPEVLRRVLVQVWRLDPRYRRRQVCHEAAHFLVGHLVGYAVQSVAADGADNAVMFDVAGPRSEAELDLLAVVSLAGVAGEVLECGNAEGGMEDVRQLRGWMELLLPQSTPRERDARIRWAMLMALTLLQQRRAALEPLAAAIEGGQDVTECVRIVEETAGGVGRQEDAAVSAGG